MLEILIPGLLFAVGVLLVVKGGDIFVDAARWISDVTGIPKFIIGATIVSLATTMPELLVSVIATMEGSVDMAIGNAVGSVSANIGLIMGISLVAMPALLQDKSFWEKAALMLGSTVVLWVTCKDGVLQWTEGLLLMALMVLFIVTNVKAAKEAADKNRQNNANRHKPTKKEIGLNLGKFFVGAAAIVLGARLLVDNGSVLARIFGVPEAVIGLTLVAIGTSLPELITTLTAISKKESALSVGNIIGANIIDMTMILATCAFISGGQLSVNQGTITLDIPIALLLGCIAVIPPLIKKRFYRWQGIVMLLTYASYVTVVVANGL